MLQVFTDLYFNMEHEEICSFIIIFNIHASTHVIHREISLDLHHRTSSRGAKERINLLMTQNTFIPVVELWIETKIFFLFSFYKLDEKWWHWLIVWKRLDKASDVSLFCMFVSPKDFFIFMLITSIPVVRPPTINIAWK